MAHSPTLRKNFTLKVAAALTAAGLLFPSPSFALRGPQGKDSPVLLSGLEESLEEWPGRTSPRQMREALEDFWDDLQDLGFLRALDRYTERVREVEELPPFHILMGLLLDRNIHAEEVKRELLYAHRPEIVEWYEEDREAAPRIWFLYLLSEAIEAEWTEYHRIDLQQLERAWWVRMMTRQPEGLDPWDSDWKEQFRSFSMELQAQWQMRAMLEMLGVPLDRIRGLDRLGTGLEEMKQFKSVPAFRRTYRDRLRSLGLFRQVVELSRRARRVPMEVWVLPKPVLSTGTGTHEVVVYVDPAYPKDAEQWIRDVTVQLPALGEGKDRIQFSVKPFSSFGPRESGKPVVVIRQVGAPGGYPYSATVVLNSLQEVHYLKPEWIYAVSINEVLRGREILLVDVLDLKDEFAIFL